MWPPAYLRSGYMQCVQCIRCSLCQITLASCLCFCSFYVSTGRFAFIHLQRDVCAFLHEQQISSRHVLETSGSQQLRQCPQLWSCPVLRHAQTSVLHFMCQQARWRLNVDSIPSPSSPMLKIRLSFCWQLTQVYELVYSLRQCMIANTDINAFWILWAVFLHLAVSCWQSMHFDQSFLAAAAL